ncbi:MAG: helix-turn-helix transcriptional regulator [Eubacteriales bacterium]|nr:helix-turn-helix transcriptional regulator [Eubacteriales bacterium]
MAEKNTGKNTNKRGENIDKRLGKRFKEYREKKGLTQEQLAEKAGMSTIFISQMERGTTFPSSENLISILKVLDITANEIFQDVLDKSYEIKTSLLSDRIRDLPDDEQRRIFSVVETMIQEAMNK